MKKIKDRYGDIIDLSYLNGTTQLCARCLGTGYRRVFPNETRKCTYCKGQGKVVIDLRE